MAISLLIQPWVDSRYPNLLTAVNIMMGALVAALVAYLCITIIIELKHRRVEKDAPKFDLSKWLSRRGITMHHEENDSGNNEGRT